MGQVRDLPNELLRYLFLMLSPKDRKMAVLVEQRWRKFGEDPVLWEWCIIVINNGEDVKKLAVRRIKHVQEIKVNIMFDWKAEELEELLKGTLDLPKLKRIGGIEWMDLRSVDWKLVGKALGKLEEIKLHGNRTTNGQRHSIFNEIARNFNLQELKLDNVTLSHDQVQDLFEAISQRIKLTTIFFVSLDVSSIEPELFGKAIANIEDVDFEKMTISADQMKAVFIEMSQNRRIKEFDSMEGDVDMTKVDPQLFAREVSKLEVFSLTESTLTDEQVIALFTELKQNCQLISLNLPGCNDLSSIDPEDLATVVNNIEEMFFGHAHLSTQQITAIFTQVQRNTRLKVLYVPGVDISGVDPALVSTAKDILKELFIEIGGSDDDSDFDGESDTNIETDADLNEKEVDTPLKQEDFQDCPVNLSKSKSPTHLPSVSSSQKEDKAEDEVDKESQVMWVESEEGVERAKVTDQLNTETQDLAKDMQNMDSFGSMNIPNNLTDVMQTLQDEDREKRKKEVKQRVFMATGWSDDTVAKAVEKLGGKLCGLGQYDSSVTHLLAVKVSRSEKMLGGVAGGKWVLHPDYVSSSLYAGRWLDEKQYEWGNPEMNYLENSSSAETKLAKAAMKWRIAISEGGNVGPFAGIQAIIHMPANKKGPFCRLIESGGGSVLEVKPPYTAPSQATHCFTEAKYLTTPGLVDLKGMAAKGIPVLQPMFLYDLLTKEDTVKVEDYLLED